MSEQRYSVHYSQEALDDLRAIYSYIAYELQAEATARGQVERIRKEIRSLDLFPERYELVAWEPWHSMGVHKVPVDNFVIHYIVDNDTLDVGILRIFYGGQDIEHMIV